MPAHKIFFSVFSFSFFFFTFVSPSFFLAARSQPARCIFLTNNRGSMYKMEADLPDEPQKQQKKR